MCAKTTGTPPSMCSRAETRGSNRGAPLRAIFLGDSGNAALSASMRFMDVVDANIHRHAGAQGAGRGLQLRHHFDRSAGGIHHGTDLNQASRVLTFIVWAKDSHNGTASEAAQEAFWQSKLHLQR